MNLNVPFLAVSALLVVHGALADTPSVVVHVNCDTGGSLQAAIDRAEPGTAILVHGTCLGPITLNRNRITLKGLGGAIINGRRKDALTVQGAQDAVLENLQISNGNNGIVATGGAHVTIRNVLVHDNGAVGILLESNSSAVLDDGGSSQRNGLNGIDLEASSSLIIEDSYTVKANAVFGLNVNNSSSLTLTRANLTVEANILGIQIGTSSGAFISDSTSVITVADNLTTGLTIVSGAHMVAFGGTIISHNNGVHGISVDSKAGFDLDAAALVESHDNIGDGVHLEETSVLTMFNTPAFSGAPGVTTLKTYNNGANGISVMTGSNLTVIHQAAIDSEMNKADGITVDNGSSLTLIQSKVVQNQQKDIILTFGSRGDIATSTIGTLICDASVFLRGDTGLTCPR